MTHVGVWGRDCRCTGSGNIFRTRLPQRQAADHCSTAFRSHRGHPGGSVTPACGVQSEALTIHLFLTTRRAPNCVRVVFVGGLISDQSAAQRRPCLDALPRAEPPLCQGYERAQPAKDVDRLASAYRAARTEFERRAVCLDAIDTGVVARRRSVAVVDVVFGTTDARKLPPAAGDLRQAFWSSILCHRGDATRSHPRTSAGILRSSSTPLANCKSTT
jgi:hypothetical protein